MSLPATTVLPAEKRVNWLENIVSQSVEVIPHFPPKVSGLVDPVASVHRFSLHRMAEYAIGSPAHSKGYAPDNKELAAAEKQAREKKLGLWADPSPTAPWDWQKHKADKKKTGK